MRSVPTVALLVVAGLVEGVTVAVIPGFVNRVEVNGGSMRAFSRL